MRKHSQSFLIYVLFGAIIAVFIVSFGPGGSGMTSERAFAAQVDGETISPEEFKRVYSQRIRFFQSQNPKAWDPKIAQQFNLKKTVLDELIEMRLLKHAGFQSGLRVSEEELRDVIVAEPTFQVNGKFDFAAYERYVMYAAGTSTARYEEDLSGRLVAQKYRDAVETTVNVSDQEVLQEYLLEQDKTDLFFIALKDSDVAVKDPTAQEITAFEADKKDAVEARYKRDEAKYNEPRRMKARHILIKVGDNAPEAEVAKAEKRIKDALVEVKKPNADFSEVAKRLSEDSSKDRGGDVGWFGPDMMVKPFEAAAQALKVGEISEPVRSPFGFHVIKLDEVKEASNKKLEEVKGEIAKSLILEQRREEANKVRAEQTLALLKSGKALKDIGFEEEESYGDEAKKEAPKGKLAYKSTGAFARSASAVPKIGANAELLKDAFAMTDAGRPADKFYRVGDKFFVVVLKERQVATPEKFKEKREELRTSALSRKRNEILRSVVKVMREKASIEVNDRYLQYDNAPSEG